MHPRKTLLAGLIALCPLPALAGPVIATDIAPIQSIAARVTRGLGEPGVILPPGASPHAYALRPSDAALLEKAEIVIWVGPELTPWLAKAIGTLAPDAVTLELETAPGVERLPIRADGPFVAHAHHDAGHDEDHKEAHHDEDHDAAGHDEAGHGDHDEAAAFDGHLWLDPVNAVAFARAIANTLAAADPVNAATYRANAEAFVSETNALSAIISERLAPVRGRDFIVFHDAYQYFEHRFDIPAAGSISLHDGESPRAAHVAELRDRVMTGGYACAFAEPNFDPKLIATITEGTPTRVATLDPEGLSLTAGADLYPALLDGLATSLATCLAP